MGRAWVGHSLTMMTSLKQTSRVVTKGNRCLCSTVVPAYERSNESQHYKGASAMSWALPSPGPDLILGPDVHINLMYVYTYVNIFPALIPRYIQASPSLKRWHERQVHNWQCQLPLGRSQHLGTCTSPMW